MAKKKQASFVDADRVKDPEGFFVIARKNIDVHEVLRWSGVNPHDAEFKPYGTNDVRFFTSKEIADQYLKDARIADKEAGSNSFDDAAVVPAARIYAVHHELEWKESGRGKKAKKTPEILYSLELKGDAQPLKKAVKEALDEVKALYKGMALDLKDAEKEYTEKVDEVKQALDDIAVLEALLSPPPAKRAPAKKAASKKRSKR